MPKTSTPAQIRKGLGEIAQLITDPRLSTALASIASDAKRFATSKANPKAFLARHQLKSPPQVFRLRLGRKVTRLGRAITLCIHTHYEHDGGVVLDENGNAHPLKIVIEDEVCTTFFLRK